MTQRLRRHASVLTLSLAAVALAALPAAQQPATQQPAGPPPSAQQPPTFRAAVDLVQLDVSVLDANRRPIRGLTAADFTVTEDGQPVSIVSFAPLDLPVAEPPPAAWMRDIASDVVRNDAPIDRLMTIVLDDANTGNGGGAWDPWIGRTGVEIAKGFVDRLGPNDRASVVFTFSGRTQNFTNDRAKLHAAIDSFVPKDSPSAGPPLGCAMRGGTGVGCTLDALQRVASALPATPPRRKMIVLISQGRGIPSFEISSGAPATLDGQTATFGPLQTLFQTLQRSNTAIYAFSPAGLTMGVGSNDNLRVFAEQTGGRALVDTNEPAAMVPAVLEETGSYYLLGVLPSMSDGRFRPVSVTVNRPGAQVRTRSGYFNPRSGGEAALATEAPAPTPTPIEMAMLAGFPKSDFALGASVAAFGVPGHDEAVVSVVSSVRPSSPPGGGPWTAEIAATAFDWEWKPRASHRQTIEITTQPGATGQTADVISAFPLRSGRYELRVAGDSGGRSGSVFLDLEVPEFASAPLSASGLVMSTLPRPYTPNPLLGGAIPVTPTARRVFARRERPEMFLRFYQGGRGSTTRISVRIAISDRSGEPIISGTEEMEPAQFGDTRAADWRFELPLDRLSPGEHLFTIEARLGAERVVRHVRFIVVP